MARGYGDTIRSILRDYNCHFVRQGRGDHEIWESPINGRRFTVDHTIKSRHTANAVLKQAGIQKKALSVQRTATEPTAACRKARAPTRAERCVNQTRCRARLSGFPGSRSQTRSR
jgi:hypothetical protein